MTSPDEQARDAVSREGVRFEPVKMRREISLKSDIRSLFDWFRILRRVRPAVTNVGTPKAGLLGGLAAIATGVPRRIYVVRGLRLEGATVVLAKILWCMERITTAVATDVVIVSDSLGEVMLNKKLVNPSKAVIIGQGSSNGVDSKSIRERVAEIDHDFVRQDLDIPDDAFVVGFIGRLTADKGIETLIESIASLRESTKIYFLLVGASEGTFKTDKLVSVNDRVRWVDATNDVPKYLAVMDVLALPTHREGFPNVVLESASAGIPTITTRATGAVDSVVHGYTGMLIDVDDSTALTDCIRQLDADPEMLERMGKAAKSRAEIDFQQDLIWRGLESIYNNRPNANVKPILHPSLGKNSKE